MSTEAFRAGFESAAEGAHALLFSKHTEALALSVPDIGVLVRRLSHDPELAARIPTELRSGLSTARASPGTTPRSRRSRRRPTPSTRRPSSPAAPTAAGSDAPLFQVNHWIATTPTPLPSNAASVNAHDFLLARTGDVVSVAAELNGLAHPGEAGAAPEGGTP